MTIHVINNKTFVVVDPDEIVDLKDNDAFTAAFGIRNIYVSMTRTCMF